MRAARKHSGEAVVTPTTRRRKREISDKHALELRAKILLRMREDDGLSVDAIALITSLSPSAVRRDIRLARAARQLEAAD